METIVGHPVQVDALSVLPCGVENHGTFPLRAPLPRCKARAWPKRARRTASHQLPSADIARSNEGRGSPALVHVTSFASRSLAVPNIDIPAQSAGGRGGEVAESATLPHGSTLES